jgi:signal recognition particle GTPase
MSKPKYKISNRTLNSLCEHILDLSDDSDIEENYQLFQEGNLELGDYLNVVEDFFRMYEWAKIMRKRISAVTKNRE